MSVQRNAVVTGSTSGIGLGVARALAQAGMNVTINGFGDAGGIEAERTKRLQRQMPIFAAINWEM